MAFLMAQASAAGRFHYGVGHGVGEVFLQAGGQAEHLRLILAVEGDDLGHLGTGVGKGAGLIKDDGVRFGCGFQKPAALDGDVLTPCLLYTSVFCCVFFEADGRPMNVKISDIAAPHKRPG